MKSKKWLILLASLAIVLLASSVGRTMAFLFDQESSSNNIFEAWASTVWVQTSQTDFEAGVLNNTDTSSSAGDVKLAVKSDWYDASWSRRAPVTINNPGSALTDYQVTLNVSYDSDMQADFDDLRFTNASDTPLDYWIESKTDGSSATVWVEVDSIAASGDTTIYMYYGNVNASTTSNGTATFYWFDNFSQDTLSNYNQFNPPTNGWGVSGGELYINMDASETLYQTTNNAPGLYFTAPSGSYISQVKIRFDGDNPNQNYESGWLYSAEGANDYVGVSHVFWSSERRLWAYEAAAAFTTLEISGYTDDVIYARIIKLNSTYTAQYSSDGNSWSDFSGSHTVTYSPEVVALSAWSYSTATCTVYFDDLLVRRYASPEPTVSVGAEEGMYVSTGILASQVLDTGVAGASWDVLSWDETRPSNTDITFEVRASDTVFLKDAASPSWTSVGGTSPVTSGLPPGRYMQWRATLTTSDTSKTPVLHEVRVYHY
jgi:hypothetical protein